MARFTFNAPRDMFTGTDNFSHSSIEELLDILRPAAYALQEYYKSTILRLFKRHTGILADSVKMQEVRNEMEHLDLNEACITVGLMGKHKGSKRAARSRADNSKKKYKKHNRTAYPTVISNQELGYLFEVGTARIAATHWMEHANEEIQEKIYQMVEEGYDKYMKARGL